MKVAVLQPSYSMNFADSDNRFDGLIQLLDKCDSSLDLIVLPEHSEIMTAVSNKQEYLESITNHHDILIKKVKSTAIKCNANVFVNSILLTDTGYRNTTIAFDRKGNIVGKYYKAHPAPSEFKSVKQGGMGIDVEYSKQFNEPYVLTHEGIRFAFLTCYDFYFYEAFARIARENVDVIIGCSMQRTDSHETLETIGKFLSYNTNSYLVRASVSLGEESKICGSSMVVSPKGEMLVNMKSQVGIATCEIDVTQKHYKQAGFRGKLKAHYDYIEEGRRPWNYRPGGSAICLPDCFMGYPRICAKYGITTNLPKNSMLSFASAISLDTNEIAFTVYPTSDKELVSTASIKLQDISNGEGLVYQTSLDNLEKLDFGCTYNENFAGLKIVKLADIFKKFSCHAIMNICFDDQIVDLYDTEILQKIVSLIKKYDLEKYVYFTTSSKKLIKTLLSVYPTCNICLKANEDSSNEIVSTINELGVKKVYLPTNITNKNVIATLHDNDIIVSAFANDTISAKGLLYMGVDTVITEEFLTINNYLKQL